MSQPFAFLMSGSVDVIGRSDLKYRFLAVWPVGRRMLSLSSSEGKCTEIKWVVGVMI